MEEFKIEEFYQQYLKLVKLNEKAMSKTQKAEMKRCFYGACGIMLVKLREDISKLPEEKGVEALTQMQNEVGDFWNKQK